MLLVLLAAVLIYFLSEKINTQAIVLLVKKAGVWGPLVYILLQSLTLIIAPISGSPVLFAGYMLFGKDVQLYSYAAAIFSGAVNFLIAKKYGRRIVIKMVGAKNIDKVDEFTKDYGIKMLIFLRLFQGQFFDFISYAFGLTEMQFWPYFIVTLLAPIPWTILWYFYLFNYVNNVSQYIILMYIVIIPFWIISGLLYAKFRKKKNSLSDP